MQFLAQRLMQDQNGITLRASVEEIHHTEKKGRAQRDQRFLSAEAFKSKPITN